MSTSALPGPPPQAIAMDLATGNWKAQAVRSFVTTNIAGTMEDLCTAENIFVSADKIAEAADLHPAAIYRLLRFLSTFDVCVEGPDKSFKLGPVGAVLTPNNPQSVASSVVWEASLTPALGWDKFDTFLKTNKSVAKEAYAGKDIWAHFAENPETFAVFQKAMTGYSNEEAFFLFNPELSPTFDLCGFKTVCDLGAAEGTLSLYLAKRFPDCEYILADLPEAVARIDTAALPPNFSTDAVDFLNSVPKADAYLLKHIIHDWDDENSEKIFANIREANPNATVFILEFGPMPGPNVPHVSKGFDCHMGVLLNAFERTQEEYNALFSRCGYSNAKVHLLAGGGHPLYIQELKPVTE